MSDRSAQSRLAIVVKGWPRLSETFIAQELVGLEKNGLSFDLWSMRQPTETKRHQLHGALHANVRYLPEYLFCEPLRVLKSLYRAVGMGGFGPAVRLWLGDLARDPTPNRIRRFGQAVVLASEAPRDLCFIYAHFLHTPSSVARYASQLRGVGWGFSAHAKDIWTSPNWELRRKLAGAEFGFVCTRSGFAHLSGLAKHPERLELTYHGLDIDRFPEPPEERPTRDGENQPVQLLSVGRLVPKKGYKKLLAALAALPDDIDWKLVQIGGGKLLGRLVRQAKKLGISDRIEWRGACDQKEVIQAMQEADLFVLASQVAGDGDRDGLPNVLMEAASQELPIVATSIAAIPEFIEDGKHGILVSPDASSLSRALAAAIANPVRCKEMATAARLRLLSEFRAEVGIGRIAERIRQELA